LGRIPPKDGIERIYRIAHESQRHPGQTTQTRFVSKRRYNVGDLLDLAEVGLPPRLVKITFVVPDFHPGVDSVLYYDEP
jgi:hypothetical protein